MTTDEILAEMLEIDQRSRQRLKRFLDMQLQIQHDKAEASRDHERLDVLYALLNPAAHLVN